MVSGLMDSFATAISLALQYGVPLQVLVRQVQPHPLRAVGLHRQPGDPDRQVDHRLHLPLAGAEVPARARTAAATRTSRAGLTREPPRLPAPAPARSPSRSDAAPRQSLPATRQDAPPCHTCGAIMVRNGACYKCSNCGATSGCS